MKNLERKSLSVLESEKDISIAHGVNIIVVCLAKFLSHSSDYFMSHAVSSLEVSC